MIYSLVTDLSRSGGLGVTLTIALLNETIRTFLAPPTMASLTTQSFQHLTVERHPKNIFVITLNCGSENKLTTSFCREIITAFHLIHRGIDVGEGGAVITRGNNEKFWCTGIDLEDEDPWLSSDGFYPVVPRVWYLKPNVD